jgi:hypothetical protein
MTQRKYANSAVLPSFSVSPITQITNSRYLGPYEAFSSLKLDIDGSHN